LAVQQADNHVPIVDENVGRVELARPPFMGCFALKEVDALAAAHVASRHEEEVAEEHVAPRDEVVDGGYVAEDTERGVDAVGYLTGDDGD